MPPHGEHIEFDERYPYDVQFIIVGKEMDVDAIRATIEAMGDCPLVVGDSETIKVHVHVADPGVPVSFGAQMGSLRDVVIEDMQAQYREFIAGREEPPSFPSHSSLPAGRRRGSGVVAGRSPGTGLGEGSFPGSPGGAETGRNSIPERGRGQGTELEIPPRTWPEPFFGERPGGKGSLSPLFGRKVHSFPWPGNQTKGTIPSIGRAAAGRAGD